MSIAQQVARHGGGLAAWSVHHPIGVVMMSLAILVMGLYSLSRLSIDLLPHIIYPDVRVRILDPGVPAAVMEDRITRQLEEQLAITEDAIDVQSQSSQGRTKVDLSFSYGTDIDQALRDASTRLDRARRFLPASIDPPIIYKRDPSQHPVLELVIASGFRDAIELRTFADYEFSKWFLNLPGVAAAEVGGGLEREIHILPDQQRLASAGLSLDQLRQILSAANLDAPGGRLLGLQQELTGRTAGRLTSVEEIAALPLPVEPPLKLSDVAQVIDTHEEERLRVRVNGLPGVKVSIQKQPSANTVAVVDEVRARLNQLRAAGLIPDDIVVNEVGDQSVFVRHAINNAVTAVLIGALLAMIVVYLFLGSLRRTLIIGSAIPFAIMFAVLFMDALGLTLNVMTIGGLALGVGMLVDNAIVMLENIHRHQQLGEATLKAPVNAAIEVNSAIVASTSTSLAAVLPFLLVGGLTGLLFHELIITISAAILASLLVALTLIPALAARVHSERTNPLRRAMENVIARLQSGYVSLLTPLLNYWLLVVLVLLIALIPSGWYLYDKVQHDEQFLPRVDQGKIIVRIKADPGIALDNMNAAVKKVETLILEQPEVQTLFSQIGGRIFGRSEHLSSSSSTLSVQLKPMRERNISSGGWIKRMRKHTNKITPPGFRVSLYQRGIPGLRLGRGDEDISFRIQGQNLNTLKTLADQLVILVKDVPGLKNLSHSSETIDQELAINIDRDRAAYLGISVEAIGTTLKTALDGIVVSDFVEGDRSFDVRLKLPRDVTRTVQDLEELLVYPPTNTRSAIKLGDVASVGLVATPGRILRDQQRRIVELSATVEEGYSLKSVLNEVQKRADQLALPPGYTLYEGGATKTLAEGRQQAMLLLALALFLVLVVMAVQYESLRNPLIILFSVPFALIGVMLALFLADITLSMPVWLGMIMLGGIVVNNAIVLVEYIELKRDEGLSAHDAVLQAAHLRLKPILMNTLTTVIGMLPLAIGLGEGAEMLQPLAITIVGGLSFSLFVSLLLIPSLYLGLAQLKT